MIVLHLGVIDMPYVSGGQAVTTSQVATWLESKYGVMQAFYDAHANEIVDDITDGLQGHLDNLLMGAPPGGDPFAAGCAKIKQRFSTFLSTQEVERAGLTGVPTQAALKGKSVRFKRGHGPRRPSFIDSGLYETTNVEWVDEV